MGKLVFHQHLLQELTTDEEFAAIIAHEVAHFVCRHVVDRFLSLENLFLLLLALRPGIKENNLPRALLSLDRPFSPSLESEADAIGLLLMAAAGYDPRVAPMVLDKMMLASRDSALGKYNTAHPPLDARLELLLESPVIPTTNPKNPTTKSKNHSLT